MKILVRTKIVTKGALYPFHKYFHSIYSILVLLISLGGPIIQLITMWL